MSGQNISPSELIEILNVKVNGLLNVSRTFLSNYIKL
jgi:hypothetical protein